MVVGTALTLPAAPVNAWCLPCIAAAGAARALPAVASGTAARTAVGVGLGAAAVGGGLAMAGAFDDNKARGSEVSSYTAPVHVPVHETRYGSARHVQGNHHSIVW